MTEEEGEDINGEDDDEGDEGDEGEVAVEGGLRKSFLRR